MAIRPGDIGISANYAIQAAERYIDEYIEEHKAELVRNRELYVPLSMPLTDAERQELAVLYSKIGWTTKTGMMGQRSEDPYLFIRY